ncbi:MAG: hypothetical protein ACR2MX_19650 [Cyclobacteriaceae bacterium]
MNDDEKLKALKALLFEDEEKVRESIQKDVVRLSQGFEIEENFEAKVEPIIQQRLESFVHTIPDKLGPVITETLKVQIKESQDEVVEALYPIMGKMIKRYVQKEIQLLSEKINKQMNSAFSFEGIKRKFRAWFSGVKEEELIMSELADPQIEEIFIIEKYSGILVGSYSKNKTLDQDMISGMLTAIKSFVEDAFSAGQQDLELIEYELYQIHIQNFKSFYIAVVLSGALTSHFRSQLEDRILNFTDKIMSRSLKQETGAYNENEFSKELEFYFDDGSI